MAWLDLLLSAPQALLKPRCDKFILLHCNFITTFFFFPSPVFQPPIISRLPFLSSQTCSNLFDFCGFLAVFQIIFTSLSVFFSSLSTLFLEFQKGLRTLVVACRHFSPEEYTDVDRCLNAARTALQQREERLQEAFSYVERDLQLLGATGVEDKYVVTIFLKTSFCLLYVLLYRIHLGLTLYKN